MGTVSGKNKSGKKAKTMSSAQRAVANRLLAKARPLVGYPSRAL
jgi:hypothetical protein